MSSMAARGSLNVATADPPGAACDGPCERNVRTIGVAPLPGSEATVENGVCEPCPSAV